MGPLRKGIDVHRLTTGFLLIGLGAAAAAACTATGQTRADRQAAGVHVEVTGLERVQMERRVNVSGTLTSPDQARMSSEVAGIVVDVLVELGSTVSAGSELVRLESRELALAILTSLVRRRGARRHSADSVMLPALLPVMRPSRLSATRHCAFARGARRPAVFRAGCP